MILRSGSTRGPYEIIQLLGAGGMGEVYCARNTRLGRRVAVKVTLADAPDDPMVLYATACYQAMYGDPDKALGVLKRALDTGYVNRIYLETDSDLRSLREDPRFEALIHRSGHGG